MEIYAKSRPEGYLKEEYIPRYVSFPDPNRGGHPFLHGVYCSRSEEGKKGRTFAALAPPPLTPNSRTPLAQSHPSLLPAVTLEF